jgi:hypothetical protein
MSSEALAHAAEFMPLYRRAHFNFITFAECGAKMLLDGPKSELDVREFELAAARVGDSMAQLQDTVRQMWDAAVKIERGLERETPRKSEAMPVPAVEGGTSIA